MIVLTLLTYISMRQYSDSHSGTTTATATVSKQYQNLSKCFTTWVLGSSSSSKVQGTPPGF